ncbi:ATP-binding protein [Desulfobotulus mexicanus]|nr:ATP-binding protein [Desulfobotulus mexicanus]
MEKKINTPHTESRFGKLFIRFYLSIFITVLATALGLQHGFNSMLNIFMKDSITAYYQDLTRGVYHVMEQDLIIQPESQWQEHIESLQPYFGYPLVLRSPEKLALTPHEKENLLSGQIVVQENGELYHKKIQGSNSILTMGKFPDPNIFVPLNMLVWIAFAIGFGVMTLVWTYPYALKLKIISQAVLAFGAGDLSSRVKIPKSSSLAPMAMAFNGMADKIGQLIASHRELVHAVSHELRTPAARIRFGLEMLASADNAKDKQRYTDGMHRDVDEMERLLSELLTYSRFDAKAPALEMQEGEIVPWLEKLVKDFQIMHPDITISLDMDPVDLCRFEPFYMARAVTNLLENAARYGRHKIGIQLFEDGQQHCIQVDDNGIGIEPCDREKIFEPFVRLDPSRSRQTGGHGLGLPIVRKIIQSHGGHILVSSSPMGGARFTLCWPKNRISH